MFARGATNPYDEIVTKATDENLTSENWEIILNLCDKVIDEGEQGARNVIAALLKRLTHRNPNVQLYALALAEALSKNCGIELHREIASRAFTQGLEKLITDRNAHDKVKRRALYLISMWTGEFENDPTLGIMEECYESLKAKNYKFEAPSEPPPPDVDDEVRRREEEELQRVLEMSMHDKGGRDQWSGYAAASSLGAGGSGSSSNLSQPAASYSRPGYSAAPSTTHGTTSTSAPKPAAPSVSSAPPPVAKNKTPPPAASAATPSVQPAAAIAASARAGAASPTDTSAAKAASPTPTAPSLVTRVRALHNFDPKEPGELAFEKGDIIKVVDRGYKDWWRGQLKGRTGIFPVNYVEPLPEPTASELAKEAEQEAHVFSQAANIDKLLSMLKKLDPAKDNLADNDEIQELYRSSMTLRPKIVKLIDKYSQKRAELVSMNESFVKARTLYDRMMEESLAAHNPNAVVYDYRSQASQRPGPEPGYGWNPALQYGPQPQPQGYPGYPPQAAAYDPQAYPPQPYGPHIDPAVYASQQAYAGQSDPSAIYQYSADPAAYAAQQAQQAHPGQSGPTPYPGQTQAGQPPAQSPQPAQQYAYDPNAQQQGQPPHVQGGQPPNQQSVPYAYDPNAQQGQPQHVQGGQPPAHQSTPYQYDPNAQPHAAAPHVQGAQAQPGQQPQQHQPQQQQPQQQQQQQQQQPQQQPQQQQQPASQASQPQAQQQAAQTQAGQQGAPAASQAGGQPLQGPPYPYDPNGQYPDPNAQAWAQYYAAGGTDPTGAAWFISVPGITDKQAPPPAQDPAQQQQQQGQATGQQPANQPAVQQQSNQPGQPAINVQDAAAYGQSVNVPNGNELPGYSGGQNVDPNQPHPSSSPQLAYSQVQRSSSYQATSPQLGGAAQYQTVPSPGGAGQAQYGPGGQPYTPPADGTTSPYQAQFTGLQGQFANMSISDGQPPQHGHPGQPAQGVGA